MQTIKVEISWEDKNYCCGWGCEGFGAVLCTNKDLATLKADFEADLRQQVTEMLADGEDVPAWLAIGDYVIEYAMSVAALLRQAEQFTTMAAISRQTGINPKLLSHYANAIKTPRKEQRKRIVDGIHTIGNQLLAVQ